MQRQHHNITSFCRYGPCGSDQLVVTERQKLVTNSAARILALARPGSPIAKANTSTCLLQHFYSYVKCFPFFRRFGAHLPGSFAAHLQVCGGHSVFDVVCLCLMKPCFAYLLWRLLFLKWVVPRTHALQEIGDGVATLAALQKIIKFMYFLWFHSFPLFPQSGISWKLICHASSCNAPDYKPDRLLARSLC